MEKMIGGIPISKWKQAFANAVEIAIDKDYFTDELEYTLYPDGLPEDKDGEVDWDYTWRAVDEAFKEVFHN